MRRGHSTKKIIIKRCLLLLVKKNASIEYLYLENKQQFSLTHTPLKYKLIQPEREKRKAVKNGGYLFF